MTRKRIIVLLLVLVLAAAAAFLAICAWIMLTPHVSDWSAASSDEFAALSGIKDLPRTARNIRWIGSSVGLGGRAYICRFEAPAEDCKAYAISTCHLYDRDSQGPLASPEFVEITQVEFRRDLSMYGIRNLEWFDVRNISQGITVESDRDNLPSIWIDTRRGVYYSCWTD